MTDFVQYNDTLGKKILYTPCKKVDNIKSNKVKRLINEMTDKMHGVGIGLAANQVGKHLQVFIIEYHAQEEKDELHEVPLQVFINPRITKASSEKVAFWHGCLSAEGKPLGEIATYKWIEYEAYNDNGKQITGRLDSMAAIIFQHEFRHLLGTLYIDHATCFLEYDQYKAKIKAKEIVEYGAAKDNVPLLLADYKVGETVNAYARRKSVKNAQ